MAAVFMRTGEPGFALACALLPEGLAFFLFELFLFAAFCGGGLLSLGGFAALLLLVGEPGFLDAALHSGGVFIACRRDAPWAGAAGFGDRQAYHLGINEAHLSVEEILDVRQQAFGREEAGASQLDGEGYAYVFGMQAHACHIA